MGLVDGDISIGVVVTLAPGSIWLLEWLMEGVVKVLAIFLW